MKKAVLYYKLKSPREENSFRLLNFKEFCDIICLKVLNVNGQHFTVNFILNGKRGHVGEIFNCHVGCVAWPFGKIKIATPLIKD